MGKKDTGINTNHDHYLGKIQWIAKKFVVLWDEEDKRGWLVNGTSALLHLVRTSLELDRTSPFSSALLFDSREMQYPRLYHPESATQALMNETNRQLAVYKADIDKPMRFQEHVTRQYEVMEKLIDYQLLSKRDDSNMGMSGSRFEGWEFNNIAAQYDPIYAIETRLNTSEMSWVNLIRSISAITLFGRGFGDIIRPVNGCSKWTILPTGQFYLAACLTDLQQISKMYHGDLYSGPVRLTDQIMWYIPEKSMEGCQCHGENDETHSNMVQVLFPSSMTSQLPSQGCRIAEINGGAVIFGHNSSQQWYQPGTGELSRNPVENTLALAEQSSSSASRDSGIAQTNELSSRTYDGSTVRSGTNQLRKQSSQKPQECLPFESYTVGIICALSKELSAVRMLFDCIHENALTPPAKDTNCYVLGSVGKHNVVATCLPHGEYGTNSAAVAANNMDRTFPSLRFCLLIGIGGGIPSDQDDIRLGDVVVSGSFGTSGGVLQHDMKQILEDGRYEKIGHLQSPPRLLRTVLNEMQSDQQSVDDHLQQQITGLSEEYRYPGQDRDILYASGCLHPDGNNTCSQCDTSQVQIRPVRTSTQPRIHYGVIASGNQVVKDSKTRDGMSKEHNALCFEMEAAGIMNILPTLVIRGICDYSDSHKNMEWQKYAAATAAAFAKVLLYHVPPLPGT